MRILLIDDHLLFREALSLMLQQLGPDISFVYAGSGAEAHAAVTYYNDLDLIIVDLALPDGDGIDLITKFKKVTSSTPVVVISACDDCNKVEAAMRAGANGYVPKKSSGPELLTAMRAVLAGRSYVPARLLAAMKDAPPPSQPCPRDNAESTRESADAAPLSTRQRQVLALLRDGAPNKVIARELNLSEGTVKLHVSAVLQLLGARNRTEAVSIATKQGLFADVLDD